MNCLISVIVVILDVHGIVKASKIRIHYARAGLSRAALHHGLPVGRNLGRAGPARGAARGGLAAGGVLCSAVRGRGAADLGHAGADDLPGFVI